MINVTNKMTKIIACRYDGGWVYYFQRQQQDALDGPYILCQKRADIPESLFGMKVEIDDIDVSQLEVEVSQD